jgi:hypothetical protein
MLTDDSFPPLPLELRWLLAHGLIRLTPWYFLESGDERRGLLRAEYKKEVRGGSQRERDVLPFAVRQDRDDVAGFVVEGGAVTTAIVTVHLTWAGRPEREGYPRIVRHCNIWEWMKSVIDDTAEWCSEEDLPASEGKPATD